MKEMEQLIEKRSHLSKMAMDPALAASLIAGGGTALAGGLLTSGTPRQPRETRAQRRRRILRNALASGVAGAGAVGAGVYGARQLMEALPEEKPEAFSTLGKIVGSGFAASGGAGAGHVAFKGSRDRAGQDLVRMLQEEFNQRTNLTGRDLANARRNEWFFDRDLTPSRVRQMARTNRDGILQTLQDPGRDVYRRLGLEATQRSRTQRYLDPVFNFVRNPRQAWATGRAENISEAERLLQRLTRANDAGGSELYRDLARRLGVTSSSNAAQIAQVAASRKARALASAARKLRNTSSFIRRHPKGVFATIAGAAAMPTLGALRRSIDGGLFTYGD